MNVKNELVVIEKITNDLRTTKNNVFPLTPTHRKELRELRKNNVANLNVKIRMLETELKQKYKEKHEKEIKKEFEIHKQNIIKLNSDWLNKMNEIVKIIEERQKFEKTFDLTNINLNCDYGDVAGLNISEIKKLKRFYELNEERTLNKIIDEEIKEKFGVAFESVRKKIDELDTSYEEAINFGDLEIVKKLYYMTKDAEQFLETLKQLKI